MDTAKKHQKKIAESTLRMTPAAARVMGGMTYPEAYKLLFGQELKPRLEQLIAEYPNAEPNQLNTELCTYGWSGTFALKELLESI